MEILILAILVVTFAFDLWLSVLNYRNRKAPLPEEVKDVYNPEEYQKWLNYSMENYRLDLFSKALEFVIILLLLILGIFPVFYRLASQITGIEGLQVLIFLALYFLIDFILGILFSYYSQFSIEERYGFNKTTLKTFMADKLKSLFLSVILGGGITYLLFILFIRAGNLFYLLAWIVIILIIVFLNLFYVKLFIPIFNKLSPLEDGELKTKIIGFAHSVGYEVNKISVINASKRSTKMNAFFSGFGHFKQVVLYDTLRDKMTTDEITAVLSHEIGHAKHKDIIKGLVTSIVMISIYLLVLLFVLYNPSIASAFGFTNASNKVVAFGFGIVIFLILLSPVDIIIGLLLNTLLRKHEYEADHYAAEHGLGQELIGALKVLTKGNFSNLTPHPLYVQIRYSHPPTSFRIKAIQKAIDTEKEL